jgi:hypothetical protein
MADANLLREKKYRWLVVKKPANKLTGCTTGTDYQGSHSIVVSPLLTRLL